MLLRGWRPGSEVITCGCHRARSLPSRVVPFLGGAATLAVSRWLHRAPDRREARAQGLRELAASPPPGSCPMAAPGKIIKVSKSDVLMPNGCFRRKTPRA